MDSYLIRMKLAHKLLIGSVFFALPQAVLLHFVVSGINADLAVTETELRGAGAIAPLQSLVELLARHERIAAAGPGPELSRTSEGIDKAFESLLAAPGGLPAERIQTARAEWSRLRSGPLVRDTGGADYRSLGRTVQALLDRLGDSSKLILDSRLDSYYLANVTLIDLPRALIRLQEISRGPHATGAPDESAMERVERGIGTALREDVNFEGVSQSMQSVLPPLLRAHRMAVQESTTLTVRPGGSTQPDASATAAMETGMALWRAVSGELQTLLQTHLAAKHRRRAITLSFSLGAMLAAAGLMFYTSRQATAPLALVTRIAGQIAAGDLEQAQSELKRAEERRLPAAREAASGAADETWLLFQAFRTMTLSLQSLLQQVRQSGVEVGGSVTGMSSAVRELEATAAQQASSTTEVAATSGQIYSSVRTLAQTMQTVRRMAGEAAALASAGMSDVREINRTMDGLLEATADISQILMSIREQTEQITGVITVIAKVADRTNLLSLNAALEAEKARESAAGFSVVATEIRRLADRTAVSALEIERSIEEMRISVEDGVAGIDAYSRKVRTGSVSMAAITASLGALIEKTRNLEPEIERVDDAMQAQASGAGEIMEAMRQLSDGAAHTKEAIGELQQVALQMRSAVRGLQSEVARFSAGA